MSDSLLLSTVPDLLIASREFATDVSARHQQLTKLPSNRISFIQNVRSMFHARLVEAEGLLPSASYAELGRVEFTVEDSGHAYLLKSGRFRPEPKTVEQLTLPMDATAPLVSVRILFYGFGRTSLALSRAEAFLQPDGLHKYTLVSPIERIGDFAYDAHDPNDGPPDGASEDEVGGRSDGFDQAPPDNFDDIDLDEDEGEGEAEGQGGQ